MFDMSNPFSGLHGKSNGATNMIMQRQMNCDLAARRFIDLRKDNFDINDKYLQQATLARYGLADATADELRYIAKQVEIGG
jgi:hypothetical protein